MKVSRLSLSMAIHWTVFAMDTRELVSTAWLQCNALHQLYNATNMGGDQCLPFHNWHFAGADELPCANVNFCGFTGVTCDDSGHITMLELNGMMLSGTLPDAIADLSCLRRLRMQNNSIGGTIPERLLQLPDLSNLNLAHNQVSGFNKTR